MSSTATLAAKEKFLRVGMVEDVDKGHATWINWEEIDNLNVWVRINYLMDS